MNSWRLVRACLTGVSSLLILLSVSGASASSPNISHSFFTSQDIPNANLVVLSTKKLNFVEFANTSNQSSLMGITVSSTDSLLAFDPDSAKIQVATSGTALLLVSDVNGSVKVGDQVSVSPFNGIGMRAEQGTYVIGLAQTGFNSKSPGATTRTVKDKDGNSKQIHVGYAKVSIAIGEYISSNGKDPNFLQKVFKSLTGHTIATWRIIASIVVALMTGIAIITLIYASIYGGIISIGRNPLAKSIIFRALSSVLVMSLLVALIGGLLIYLMLR